MKNLITTLIAILLLLLNSSAQTASIKGIVMDKKEMKPLANVNLLLFKNKLYEQTAVTDSLGRFEIKYIYEGTYSIAIRYPNYVKINKEQILIKDNEVLKLDTFKLTPLVYTNNENEDMDSYKSTELRKGTIGTHVSGESMQRQKSRSLNKIAGTTAGAYSNAASPSYLGSRSNNQTYYYSSPQTVYSKSPSHPKTNQQKLKAADRGYATITYTQPSTTVTDVVVSEKPARKDSKQEDKKVISDSVKVATSAPPEETIGREEYNEIIETPFKPTHKNLLSTFSIDVDKAAYSNMRRYLQQNLLPPKDVVRTEELLNYFTYNYPQPSDDKPFSITTEMADCPWNKKHKLVHIGIQGKIISMDKIPAMNLVFLVDVSGSMQTYNKLPLVIESLKMLTAQLRPQDKISIVIYAGGDGVALPPTSGADKNKIYQALQNLRAGGGTNGAAGINRAYLEAKNNFIVNGNNRVILCTDGDFNVGVSSKEELQKLIEEKRKTGIFLSALGFGMGNYKDNTMEMLADKGNGNYAYIDKIEEAKKVFVHEIGGTLFTIAKDVKIQMEFNPMFIKEYRLIGYENRILNNEDFANDAIDAGDLGSGHNVTALYEIVPNLDKSEQGVLKYDASDITPSKLEGNEWLFVKMRYKDPNDSVSKLLIHKLDNTMTNNPTANFYFSAAVVEFAMLMHNSLYKGTSNFEEVKTLATNYAANDSLGYKKEFVDLVKIAEQLSGMQARR